MSAPGLVSVADRIASTQADNGDEMNLQQGAVPCRLPSSSQEAAPCAVPEQPAHRASPELPPTYVQQCEKCEATGRPLMPSGYLSINEDTAYGRNQLYVKLAQKS